MHQQRHFQPRPFNPSHTEYQAVAELLNKAQFNSRRPATADSLKEDDADWEDDYLNQRYVVEEITGEDDERQLVLVGSVFETFWAYQPGDVNFIFELEPDYNGHGIEEIFYDYLVEQLMAQTPTLERLIIGVVEDKIDRIAFLESKGFTVRERDTKSALTLQNADLSPLAGLEEAALAGGIRIYTLAQVKALVPDWKVQLHQLRSALDRDVPGVGPAMETTLEQFERMFLQDPALDPEAWWIAVDESSIKKSEDKEHDYSTNLGIGPTRKAVVGGKTFDEQDTSSQSFSEKGIGKFIGYSNLWINDETRKRLDTGMTGVLRSHRRRGIATLLKYKAIAYGTRHNSERIVTSNEENNPMLDLNYKLGFEPIPGWICYEKIFQTEKQ